MCIRDSLQTLYRNCIDGIADGSADSNSTAEGIACIIDRRTIGIGDWLVLDVYKRQGSESEE